MTSIETTVRPEVDAVTATAEVTTLPAPVSSNSKLNCQILGKQRINCSSEVYSDPATWRLSRDYLEQQIRILRVQLDELKVIRKHLRAMRPPGSSSPQGGEFTSSPAELPLSRPDAPDAATASKQRKKTSKSKASGDSSLIGWPSNHNATTDDDLDEEEQTGSRRSKPVAVQEVGGEEAETTGPAETIEVTIYDNRKIKQVLSFSFYIY